MGFASPYVTGQRQCDVNVLLSDGDEKKMHSSKWFSEFVAFLCCTTQRSMIITIPRLAFPLISERICCALFHLSVNIDFRSMSPELQAEKLGHASDGSRENHTGRAEQGSNRNEKA
jgi:hypothetical protein